MKLPIQPCLTSPVFLLSLWTWRWAARLPQGMIGIPIIILLSVLGSFNEALAQITPDDTLGNAEASTVTPDVNVRGELADLIDGGARRGRNLFHSFSEFNIDDLQRVYFDNPIGVETIFSRVTGTDVSDILGTLGVDGTADVFFLNPNGIIFGENAQLDIGGSFVATTADALQFENLGLFSGRNPTSPSPLLTIDPSAFLFGTVPTGDIVNQSTATVATDGDFPGLEVGLRVPNGENLLLLGGDVLSDGGYLSAFGGRVDVGSIAGVGSITLNEDGSVTVPDGLQRGTVIFENGALVDVRLDDAGDIAVTAGTIQILDSVLQAGIRRTGLGTTNSQAGDIILNATDRVLVRFSDSSESPFFPGIDSDSDGFPDFDDVLDRENTDDVIEISKRRPIPPIPPTPGVPAIPLTPSLSLSGRSGIGALNVVDTGAVGNGGNISITTPILEVRDGELVTSTLGEGNAGDVLINASDRITIDSTNSGNLFRSSILSLVGTEAIGNGGEIDLTTSVLQVKDETQIIANSLGRGNAGSVTINARDRITFSNSSAFSATGANTIGNGGNIDIMTSILTVRADEWSTSSLTASSFGQDNAGSITINASDRITLDGPDFSLVGIFNSVGENGIGNGGDIDITTPTLKVSGGSLTASNLGQGNAGSVMINASDRVTLSDSSIFSSVGENGIGNGGDIDITTPTLNVRGGSLTASNLGQGDAGSVMINASDRVTFTDGGSAFSAIGSNAIGNGGNITITTPTLEVGKDIFALAKPSSLTAISLGRGNAGSVTINASDRVTFSNSSAFSSIGENAVGNGGNIDITTANLTVDSEGSLTTSSLGKGNAGSVTINASDRVTFNSGGSAFSSIGANAVGNGGDITITTATLGLSASFSTSSLTTSSFGQGNVGNVTIDASDGVTFNGNAAAFSAVGENAVGNNGDINIHTSTLDVVDGGQLISSTFGQSDAGNVIIKARDRVTFHGISADGDFRSAAFSLIEAGAIGDGGNVVITTPIVQLFNGSQLVATSFGLGNSGDVIIDDSEYVVFDDSAALSVVEVGASGDAGNININTQRFELRHESAITSSTRGKGRAGNVEINADESISLDNSRLLSRVRQTAEGNGGKIELTTRMLDLRNGTTIDSSTSNQGNAGNVVINSDRIIIDSDSTISSGVRFGGVGNGGNIIINTGVLDVLNGAQLEAISSGTGDAGNILIAAANGEVSLILGQISTSSEASGRAGGISVTSGAVALRDGTIEATSSRGTGGDIDIDTSFLFMDNGQISTDAGNGGGNITIQVGTFPVGEINALTDIPSNPLRNLLSGDSFAGLLWLNNGSTIQSRAAAGIGSGRDIRVQTRTAGADRGRDINGGDIDIDIDAPDTLGLLVMSNESKLSAAALDSANGGNIDIDINAVISFILALSPEGLDGSDIIASAARGNGGKITFSVQDLIGIEERPATPDNQTNDIDASSRFGNSGQVVLNTLGIDPSRGVVELPVALVETPPLEQGCRAANLGTSNRFVLTGRGGLPDASVDPPFEYDASPLWITRETSAEAGGVINRYRSQGDTSMETSKIIEARGWAIAPNGTITLAANATSGEFHSSHPYPGQGTCSL